ncbi:MAG: internal scaffolding protein [Microviridae sp.]|nr:MAG: internal scaffolding protein [Microviridae sp.]
MKRNPFTGEEMKTIATIREDKRKAGLLQLAADSVKMVEYGEPGSDGKRAKRPASVGVIYDIPALDESYKEDCVDQIGADLVDLNRVMKRFEKSGELAELIKLGMGREGVGDYADFTGAPDFQAALDIVNLGKEQFSLLSAPVRERFGGDASKFMDFVSDPKNVDEMERLGLLKPDVVAARQAARNKPSSASVATGAPQATPPASSPAGGQPAAT